MGQVLSEWTHLCPIGRGEDGTRFEAMEGEPPASPSILTSIQVRLLGQEVKEMDVKGAKALSERLAESRAQR